MMVSTLLETHKKRGTQLLKKPHRWENLLDGSWIHPELGIVRKVTAGHKFKFDWYSFPEELNLKNKLGPFLNRTEAIQALKDYRKRLLQHDEP